MAHGPEFLNDPWEVKLSWLVGVDARRKKDGSQSSRWMLARPGRQADRASHRCEFTPLQLAFHTLWPCVGHGGSPCNALHCALRIYRNESHWAYWPCAGGYVRAGYHEVVNTEQCHAAASAAIAAGESAWRISSTMFTTVNHDTVLEPLGNFKGEATASQYPPVKAGQQVADELAKIGLADEATTGNSKL